MALSLLLKELPKLFFPEERDVLPRPRGVEPGGNSCDAMTRSMTAGAWRFQNIAAYAQPDSKETVALSKLQFFMFYVFASRWCDILQNNAILSSLSKSKKN